MARLSSRSTPVTEARPERCGVSGHRGQIDQEKRSEGYACPRSRGGEVSSRDREASTRGNGPPLTGPLLGKARRAEALAGAVDRLGHG
jgi:hypothetical protein